MERTFDSLEDAVGLLDLLDGLWSSPEFFPIELDLDRETLAFVKMTAEAYREAFHVPSWLEAHSPKAYRFRLEPFLRRFERSRPQPRRLRFIFHPSLSGSTLLSRALDATSQCHSLREPSVLNGLSEAIARSQASGDDQERLSRVLRLVLSLFGRAWTGEQTPVVKLSDAGSLVFLRLLNAEADSRGLFLYTDLRTHVAASLKSPDREKWLRGRAKWLQEGLFPGQNADPPTLGEAPPARIAAALWVHHVRAYRMAFDVLGPDLLRALDFSDFLNSPDLAIGALQQFFGIPPSEYASGLHEALSVHAKVGGNYSAESRAADLASAFARFEREIEDAGQWIRTQFPADAPAPLPGILIAPPS